MAAAIKKPSDWTLFLRHAKREGAVCYGRAPTPPTIGERVRLKVPCIAWVAAKSGNSRYYAFKSSAQLAYFLRTVRGAVEIDIAST